MRIIFILLFACFTSWSAKLYASTWDEGRWIVCNTCQSELQFQQAAVNMHGSATHPAIYAVGNFESIRFKYVIIYPRRHPEAPHPGQRPLGLPAAPHFSGNMLIAQSTSMAVTSHQNVTPSLAARLNTGMHIEIREPTHGERLQFEAIIRISRNFVVIRPENGYFSSFADAQQKIGIVDAMLNAALVANNPGYRNNEISKSFLTSLWSILGHMYGRGPGGCIIFDNGDSACFQINIMLPGAARTLRGSAKDINGKPLEEWNSLPNKNGYGLSVSKDNPQTGWFTWTPMPGSRSGGRQSVSCSSHNGIMRCTVRPY